MIAVLALSGILIAPSVRPFTAGRMPPIRSLADESVLKSSLEVEVLSEDEIEVLSAASLYHPATSEDGGRGGRLAAYVDDSLANAYGGTLSLFQGLLDQRNADSESSAFQSDHLTATAHSPRAFESRRRSHRHGHRR